MTDHLLDALLGVSDDPGCEAAFDQLDGYCDALRRGRDAARLFPGVAAHIRNCPACREDTEGLLAALALQDERGK